MSTRHIPLMNVKFTDLTRTHFELITAYVDALNQVSRLQSWLVYERILDLDSFIEAIDTPEKRREYPKILYSTFLPVFKFFQSRLPTVPTLSYLIRLFVESHIKGKLNELSVSYLYLMQTIPDDYPQAGACRAWLKDTIETCEKLAATLSSLQSAKGLISTLWPIMLNVAAAVLGISTLKDLLVQFSWSQFFPWIVFIAIPFAYFFVIVSGAFWAKRELFTGYTLFESIFWSIIPLPANKATFSWLPNLDENIYHLEDQLFALLKRGKKREFRWDMLTMPISLVGIAMVGFSEWLNDPTQPMNWPIFALLILFSALFMFMISLRKWD